MADLVQHKGGRAEMRESSTSDGCEVRGWNAFTKKCLYEGYNIRKFGWGGGGVQRGVGLLKL